MKMYLNPKPYRLHLGVNIGLYANIFAIILVILGAALSPLWVYHIPLNGSASALNTAQTATPSPWIILIEKEGEYYVKQGKQTTKVISLDSLKNMLMRDMKLIRQSQRPIWLQANSQVQYGHIKQVILRLQSVGIQQVGLMTAAELG